MIWWQRDVPAPSGSVRIAFTDVEGGVSEGPFASCNLGDHVGDDPARVDINRQRVCEAAGFDRLIFMQQVHGARVTAVGDATLSSPADTDAMVCRDSNLGLAVLVADCTPVVLWDDAGTTVACLHAGRAGMLAGVVGATVAAMRGAGAGPLQAVVGPSICGACYEVPAEMREAALAVEPECDASTPGGGAAIDVAAGVMAQLSRADVDATRLGGCTRESPQWYSYRRSGQTGRFAAIVGLRRGDGR